MAEKIVGLDIGYGYTKVFIKNRESKDQKYLFPTIVSKYVTPGSFCPTPLPVEFSLNGDEPEKFYIGEDITASNYGHFAVRPDFVDSKEYYAIISHIIAKEKDIDTLVLGLPPAMYDKNRATSLIENIKKIKIRSEREYTIPSNIYYIPQGAGIFFAYIANKKNDITKNTIVIDIGHYTLDMVLFTNGKYVSGFAYSFPLGVKTLIDEIKNAFSKKFGVLINNDATIINLIQDGKIELLDKVYEFDCSLIVDNFYKHQIQNVVSSYSSRLVENSIKVENVILGGGGVSFINTKSAIIVNDAQFANARGFCEYGKMLRHA